MKSNTTRKAPARTTIPPRVALVIETSTSFGRTLLGGIAAYVRENRPWSVYFGERSVFDPVPDWLQDWKGDGIISRTTSPKIREVIAKSRVPVVDLNEQLGGMGVPMIAIDHHAVGRLAALHLLEKGFTNFAYVGHAGLFWSVRRAEEFSRTVASAGHSFEEYGAESDRRPPSRRISWHLEMDRIAGWVSNLRKPVGILACDDFRALQLLAACRLADVAVPEQAAVIGVGADDVSCALADPPLSSVVLNAWRMGYEAAAILDGLMRGQKPQCQEIRIPPLEIAARQSTDVTAIADVTVAMSLRFIREHACDGINVEDVVRRAEVSRTALQDRFRNVLGRPIHDVIVEARIARVRELLAKTALSLQDIAERSGFRYPEYMSSVFKQRTGWTPARYRQEHGSAAPSERYS
jgi:LacI family transcriptional regulator